MKMSEKPSQTKDIFMFIDELINHESSSFAKNAAAFFKKRFSFSSSAIFLLRLWISFAYGLSACNFKVYLHSSLYFFNQHSVTTLVFHYILPSVISFRKMSCFVHVAMFRKTMLHRAILMRSKMICAIIISIYPVSELGLVVIKRRLLWQILLNK